MSVCFTSSLAPFFSKLLLDLLTPRQLELQGNGDKQQYKSQWTQTEMREIPF